MSTLSVVELNWDAKLMLLDAFMHRDIKTWDYWKFTNQATALNIRYELMRLNENQILALSAIISHAKEIIKEEMPVGNLLASLRGTNGYATSIGGVLDFVGPTLKATACELMLHYAGIID